MSEFTYMTDYLYLIYKTSVKKSFIQIKVIILPSIQQYAERANGKRIWKLKSPKVGKLSSEVNKKEMQTTQFSQEILELLKSSVIIRTKKGSEYREDRILLQGCYLKIFFLAIPLGMWNPSSPNKDQNLCPCIWNTVLTTRAQGRFF